MDFAILNDLFGQMLHILIWSSLMLLAVKGSLYLHDKLQYWSALWKVTLLLSTLR